MDFPYEFVKPFEICFDLLSRSYINIFHYKISFFKGLRRLIFLVCALTFYITLLVRASKVFKGEIPFVDFAYIVSVVMVATQGILKAAIIVPKQAEIRAIIIQLGKLWRTDDLTETQIEIKNYLLKRLNICHSVFYWMNIIGSWQYMLVPLFETLFKRFIQQQPTELSFPFACSLPFAPAESWARYIAVYIFEIYSMLRLVYIYLGAEFLLITLCAHLSTEFLLLQEDLKRVRPVSDRNKRREAMADNCDDKGLKYVVKRHHDLIKISKLLDNIFNRMIFINLLFASITICFFGFVTKIARGPVDMVNNFVAVFASILPIFNLCYYGELLIGASSGIADAAVESLWYNGAVTHQKMILLIIKRSQVACSLTSLRYSPVSLNTFTTVMSTTWSYFSLATSVYNKNS